MRNARANPDWQLTSVPKAQLYQRIIAVANEHSDKQLTEEEAKKIIGKLLAAVRMEHLHSLLEKIIPDEKDREKIKLDQAIKVGVAIQDYITDDIIKETIKQTFSSLWDQNKKRFSTEKILDTTLASLTDPERASLLEPTRETLVENIETQNNALNTLFNALDDNGIKYYLNTLLLQALDDDDQLKKQQELIALVSQNKLKDAITRLVYYSQDRAGRADDLDEIRGAMLLDWDKYWQGYGGMRRSMTKKEAAAIIAQQAEALQQVELAQLRERADNIDEDLLTKASSKRHLEAVQETLRKASITQEEIDFAKQTLDNLETEEVIKKALDDVEDTLGGFKDNEEAIARQLIQEAINAAKQKNEDYTQEDFIENLAADIAVQVSSRLGSRESLVDPKIL